MTAMPTEPAVFRVLLVCTGNICRSAMAERFGRAYLDELLGDDARVVELASAGTRAVVGSAMHPDSALALRGFGAEAGDFRARQLDSPAVTRADLVLTMTRGHRHDVLQRDPRALSRTFTVREAAALAALLAPGPLTAEGEPATRARRLVAALAAARARRRADSSADDVPDPIRGPAAAHEEAAQLVVGSLLPVLHRLGDELRGQSSTAPAPTAGGAHSRPPST